MSVVLRLESKNNNNKTYSTPFLHAHKTYSLHRVPK